VEFCLAGVLHGSPLRLGVDEEAAEAGSVRGGGTNAPAATISAQAATGGALRWPGLAKGSRWGLRRQPVRAMRNGARGGHGSAFKVARLAPGSRRGREQVADRCGRGVERSWRRRRLAQPAWAASSRSCAGRQRARERERAERQGTSINSREPPIDNFCYVLLNLLRDAGHRFFLVSSEVYAVCRL
jgi:hypothetical protein